MKPDDILGYYRLISPVATDATDMVWVTQHQTSCDYRVVKILPTEVMTDDNGLRCQSDGRLLIALRHRHIVPVHDVDIVRNTPYMAMTYLMYESGDPVLSLTDVLPPAGKVMNPDKALFVMLQLCDALAYAHQNKVVHRNIKPGVVLFDENANVRLAGFGVGLPLPARLHTGSRAFMPPEVREGQPPSPQGDIYALGALALLMLTGKTPNAGTIRLPSTVNPAIPAAWDAILTRATDIDPEDRYPDAAAMLADIRTICLDTSTLKSPAVIRKVVAQPFKPQVIAPKKQMFLIRFAREIRDLVAIILVVMLLLYLTGVWKP